MNNKITHPKTPSQHAGIGELRRAGHRITSTQINDDGNVVVHTRLGDLHLLYEIGRRGGLRRVEVLNHTALHDGEAIWRLIQIIIDRRS